MGEDGRESGRRSAVSGLPLQRAEAPLPSFRSRHARDEEPVGVHRLKGRWKKILSPTRTRRPDSVFPRRSCGSFRHAQAGVDLSLLIRRSVWPGCCDGRELNLMSRRKVWGRLDNGQNDPSRTIYVVALDSCLSSLTFDSTRPTRGASNLLSKGRTSS